MPILPIDAGRYGSKEIRAIFDEQRTLDYQLEFEMVVAEAQSELGLIPKDASREIAEIVKSKKITTDIVKELEKKTEHDTAAMVQAISDLANIAKPWIHYGLTSYDVIDSRISMQVRDALNIIEPKIKELLSLLIDHALKYKELPAVGRTHGQHASIISFGLKFGVWISDMIAHLQHLNELKPRVLLCKTLGVVGTGSLMNKDALRVQELVAKKLGLYPIDAATQVISRERHAELLQFIALLGGTLDKIAVEIRNLQRSEIYEVSEPFKEGQMGSSAVPVKRNPIKSERVSSLARILKANAQVALDNISLWHERDLSNSANERFIIPISLILLDEMLESMIKVMKGLRVNEDRIKKNIELSKGHIFAEFVLEAMVKKGIARLDAYRLIQEIAFDAYDKDIHLLDALKADNRVLEILNKDELDAIFDAKNHLGASMLIIDNVVNKARRWINDT
ncbi:MAG: adenylosuccinate lyase [Candidatus Nitrosocaldaceae archaeon]|nr:MAG: adenylosuccinate lyase [Candidatus Nitrosocaldaceae archaeon]